MKLSYLLCIAASTLLITGCKVENLPQSATSPDTLPSTETGQTQDGPYSGVLPCADCPGIKTDINFYYDSQTNQPVKYFQTETYIGQTSPLSSQGKFITLEKNGQTILQIDPDDPELTRLYQKINDKSIKLLDKNGNEIKSSLNYTLVK